MLPAVGSQTRLKSTNDLVRHIQQVQGGVLLCFIGLYLPSSKHWNNMKCTTNITCQVIKKNFSKATEHVMIQTTNYCDCSYTSARVQQLFPWLQVVNMQETHSKDQFKFCEWLYNLPLNSYHTRNHTETVWE